MIDIEKLKALAEAAPTGPWLAENDSLYFKDDGYTRHLLDADAGHDVEDPAYYAALAFIAAANPAVVLELIESFQRADDELSACKEGPGTCGYWRDAARAHLAEIEKLKAENEDGLAVIRTQKEQLECYIKDAERYRLLRQYTVDSYLAQGSFKSLDRDIDAVIEKQP